jgi:hypothetical protein
MPSITSSPASMQTTSYAINFSTPIRIGERHYDSTRGWLK